MENQRLKELAGLVTERKWSGEVKAKWTPPKGMFDGSGAEIVKGLLAAPGGASKAVSRLNFYINRAGKNLSDEQKEKLEKAKAELKKKHEMAQEEAAAYCRRAGLIFERKKAEDEEPDMDMGDDMADDKGGKKGGEEEDALPAIVKKIAKKAVGKDEDELESLIMKVYDAGHKDGMKSCSDKVEESVDEAIAETMDMDDMKKQVDSDEMRKRVIKANGNPFGKTLKDKIKKKVKEAEELTEKHHVKKGGKVTKKGSKAECDKHAEENGGEVCKGDGEEPMKDEMKEAALTEKHHVKKGGKITKRGSKKECDDHAEKNGGDVMSGEGGIEESEDLEDIDFGNINEDWTEVKAAMAHVRTDRLRAPCMTPKGSGTIEVETATLPKGMTDPKAGPYEHTVTVKLNSGGKGSFPANSVKFFKGQKPDGKMFGSSNPMKGGAGIANADKGVTAKGTQANEPGKHPSANMWKA